MTLIIAEKGQSRITEVTVCEVNWWVQMFDKGHYLFLSYFLFDWDLIIFVVWCYQFLVHPAKHYVAQAFKQDLSF